MDAPKFDRNHPDFPWGFYSFGENVYMVSNAHRVALKTGTAVLNVPQDTGKASIVPVAGKPKGFRFFK